PAETPNSLDLTFNRRIMDTI
uniref:Urotensin I homolog n=1 Tax=Scyliorhinus canicula TaxID=7830 RepID=Q9PRN6_SCYCA|nr:urotensin I homolog [Scyliorhinus canicula=dogfish, caudal spinal cord, Peptide, 20 aa] [Scyliorhinus canicula]